MRLDSDTPNADAQLHVEFYTYEEDGPWKGVPHVRIMTPGDKTNIIQRPVRESDKQRFQRQWLHYQRDNSDHLVVGTSLSQWRMERPEELTDGQLQELTILKFQTVEQIAMASDGQIMRVGMGATGLRERAKAYLTSKNAQQSGAELAKAQAELIELRAMIANIASMQTATPLAAAKPKGKRGGWNKGKKKVPVNVRHNDAATGATGRE